MTSTFLDSTYISFSHQALTLQMLASRQEFSGKLAWSKEVIWMQGTSWGVSGGYLWAAEGTLGCCLGTELPQSERLLAGTALWPFNCAGQELDASCLWGRHSICHHSSPRGKPGAAVLWGDPGGGSVTSSSAAEASCASGRLYLLIVSSFLFYFLISFSGFTLNTSIPRSLVLWCLIFSLCTFFLDDCI